MILKKANRFIPEHIKFLFATYLTGILFFTVFRLILFITETRRLADLPGQDAFTLIIKAFFMGWRFDTVISGYLLSLPFVILLVTSLFRVKYKIVFTILFWYIYMIYVVAFFICAADIPYFNQFFSRFNISAFAWTGTPGFVAKMIVQEISYWWTIIPFLIVCFIFYKGLKKIIIRYLYPGTSQDLNNNTLFFLRNVGISLLFGLIMFAGIRGRLSKKSPIRVGTAYFSNYAFPNQLGLNPVFTLMRSYLNSIKESNKGIQLIDNNVAISNVKKFLNFRTYEVQISPIARQIIPDSVSETKHNVIIVIMESMSAAKMGRYGNKNNLTPYLDSLAENGYSFDNTYTSGIHTFSGVYSTLFSFPTIGRQHPMAGVDMLKYHGIGTVLKQNGYSTIYFTTHDDQFDNIGGFLSANDFERIVSQKDFPSAKVLSTLGVPDDYLFESSIPTLNELHKNNKPFIAAYMTASDHGPYIIPEYFSPKQADIKKQIIEYADWSIGKFIELSSKQPWYNNTLFVFMADHGSAMNSTYDMPLNYHHSPLIFFAPKILNENKSFNCIGGQIDIFPTVMGLLRLPYVNNTLGIDLLKEKRPFIYFNANDKYGVINDEFFLVVRENGLTSLYKYKEKDTKNYVNEFPEKVDHINNYAKSNIQVAQWLIENKKTRVKNND